MIIQKCTQYHVEDRYSSCRELQYDLEHPEALGAPYRKKLKNKLRLFGACAGLAFILGGLSLTGFAMETHTKKNGYDYYISEALTKELGMEVKTDPQSRYAGAIGAALGAVKKGKKN